MYPRGGGGGEGSGGGGEDPRFEPVPVVAVEEAAVGPVAGGGEECEHEEGAVDAVGGWAER